MPTLSFSKHLLILSILLLLFIANAQAQESNINSFMNRASQYYLGTKDEILIKVNVWGYVSKSGQYLVPRHTDLVSLISFAGGPREGANLKEVYIIRGGNVNSGHNGHNGEPEQEHQTLKINVKDYLKTGKTGLIPVLEPGDTILISQTFGNKFQKVLGVTSVVGLIAASATLIIAIERL